MIHFRCLNGNCFGKEFQGFCYVSILAMIRVFVIITLVFYFFKADKWDFRFAETEEIF